MLLIWRCWFIIQKLIKRFFFALRIGNSARDDWRQKGPRALAGSTPTGVPAEDSRAPKLGERNQNQAPLISLPDSWGAETGVCIVLNVAYLMQAGGVSPKSWLGKISFVSTLNSTRDGAKIGVLFLWEPFLSTGQELLAGKPAPNQGSSLVGTGPPAGRGLLQPVYFSFIPIRILGLAGQGRKLVNYWC